MFSVRVKKITPKGNAGVVKPDHRVRHRHHPARNYSDTEDDDA